MGAAPSLPTEDIKEIATSTMKTFTPFYIKGYAAQLIKQLKKEANPDPKVARRMSYFFRVEHVPVEEALPTRCGVCAALAQRHWLSADAKHYMWKCLARRGPGDDSR